MNESFDCYWPFSGLHNTADDIFAVPVRSGMHNITLYFRNSVRQAGPYVKDFLMSSCRNILIFIIKAIIKFYFFNTAQYILIDYIIDCTSGTLDSQ